MRSMFAILNETCSRTLPRFRLPLIIVCFLSFTFTMMPVICTAQRVSDLMMGLGHDEMVLTPDGLMSDPSFKGWDNARLEALLSDFPDKLLTRVRVINVLSICHDIELKPHQFDEIEALIGLREEVEQAQFQRNKSMLQAAGRDIDATDLVYPDAVRSQLLMDYADAVEFDRDLTEKLSAILDSGQRQQLRKHCTAVAMRYFGGLDNLIERALNQQHVQLSDLDKADIERKRKNIDREFRQRWITLYSEILDDVLERTTPETHDAIRYITGTNRFSKSHALTPTDAPPAPASLLAESLPALDDGRSFLDARIFAQFGEAAWRDFMKRNRIDPPLSRPDAIEAVRLTPGLKLTETQANVVRNIVVKTNRSIESTQETLRTLAEENHVALEDYANWKEPMRTTFFDYQLARFADNLEMAQRLEKILTPAQSQAVHGTSVWLAAVNLNGMPQVVQRAILEHEVESRWIPCDQYYSSVSRLIDSKYQQTIAEIQDDLLQRVIATYPSEARQAIEFIVGIDTLRAAKR